MNGDPLGRTARGDSKPAQESPLHFGWALPVGRALAAVLAACTVMRPDLMLAAALLCLMLQALGELSLPILACLPRNKPRHETCNERAARISTTLVTANLGNEEAVLLDSIDAFHAAGARVVVASNGHSEYLEAQLPRHENLTWTHDSLANSKAANLNRAIHDASLGSDIFLADADTQPLSCVDWGNQYPEAELLVFPRLIRLQSTSALERIVAIEFAVKTLLTYPSRFRAAGVVYFGGSAARCRLDLLKRIGFRPGLLVEDIDFSIRSQLASHCVAYSSDCYFTELAPPSVAAWITQRRRWASGWLQLCSQHALSIIRSPLPPAARALWAYLLIWRRLILPSCLLVAIAALAAGATISPALPLTCAAIQLSATVRLGVVYARHRAIVNMALGESSITASALYCLLAVPYTIALYLVDLLSLVFPAKSWRVTPRTANAEMPNSPYAEIIER